MTYGEFYELCNQKVLADNPERLKNLPEDPIERIDAAVNDTISIIELKHLLVLEIGAIMTLLAEELNMIAPEKIDTPRDFLPHDFILSPRANERAERLRTLNFFEPRAKQ
jgi:hypothetical protein